MRVSVLLHWNGGEETGVFKKVVSQIHTWRTYEVAVSLHVVSRRPLGEVWQQHLEGVPVTFHIYNKNKATRLQAWRNAVKALESQHPDVVYHRYDLYMPVLSSLCRKYPVVLEINTNDLVEYCLVKGLRCWYNRITRAWLLGKAAGLVFMTWELANSPHFRRYQRPSVVISNGINLEDFQPLPPARNREPHLVFVGSEGQLWHGLDKIIRLAFHFPHWHFDIVGLAFDKLPCVPSNVSFRGILPRAAYEALLAKADIAIGTLALHRKHMNEGCSLKVREYLAYGLPVIIGYKDTDFLQGAPFILELPNTEDNIEKSISEIRDFVSRWQGRRVPREVVAHLDIRIKESQRIAFLQSVLETRRTCGVST